MRIWITRTEPGASRLAETLRRHGHVPVVKPVMAVEHLAVPPAIPASCCVVLSGHAVWAAANYAPQHGFIAVGGETARALRELGVGPVVFPDEQSSHGVVQLISTALTDPGEEPVVLLTGEGGTEQVQQFLVEKAIAHIRVNAYRRVQLSVSQVPEGIDAIVVSSGEALDPLRELLGDSPRLADTWMVVPSTRIEAIARESGFRRIQRSAGASPAEVLEGLSKLVV